VLIQIGRVDVGGQRPALGAIGGSNSTFAVAAVGIRHESAAIGLPATGLLKIRYPSVR